MQARGYQDLQQISQIMQMLTQAYNQETLMNLLTVSLPADVNIVFNPYELDTLVNAQNYIGQYEPKELLLVQDIPRINYTMYLQKDAYNALLKLYNDLSQEYKGFLLRGAYQAPQTLAEDEVGYNESQLGLTIVVTQTELPYQQFTNTEMSQWLEEHAYEYGFILRYPQRKASITNHAYDAHIYRYVGKSLAKSLHDSELTLEEYQLQNEGE
ncbi:M15 family metallopeptidase [Allocoprobacillus halotolerans]|uniref:M15 family metallopeptidase n=1 Tax=Allocoprobacillus halotolerans TaxID=2944914 RepID=A0ABY5I0F7_9FIRM|nr:M15 family metallopeptidase [Allocoprobacillus halotolerans]UTY38796.1 M15 family metallopeptidase [Allocoprobacillus halotolerans]